MTTVSEQTTKNHCVEDMIKNEEDVPGPIATRQYSGKSMSHIYKAIKPELANLALKQGAYPRLTDDQQFECNYRRIGAEKLNYRALKLIWW